MANPRISPELMAYLKDTYKPRCRRPDEGEREHERYAGKVDLVADLEARFLEQLPTEIVVAANGDLPEGITFEELYEDND